MGELIDISGQTFGRLAVIERRDNYRGGTSWLCRCECGTEKVTTSVSLRKGRTRSCGCLARETRGALSYRHGKHHLPEYKVWGSMVQRCTNPRNDAYHNYGGRGIGVCARWRDSFDAFYEDMGPRPSTKHSIERRKNDRGYEPDNCEWATKQQQSRNTRQNRFITHNGETLTATDWERRLGMPRGRLLMRLWSGWTELEAITIPLGGKRHGR
jgi:hypothetical protein